MTVYKRPGSPYYSYDFIFEGRRYQKSTHLKDKVQAGRVEAAKKTELALRRGGIVPKKNVPVFSTFAKKFLEEAAIATSPSTHRGYSVSVRNLSSPFGSKRLDEITPEMIRDFKVARKKQKRSNPTVNRDLACLRRIFSIAVKYELVMTSPFFARRVEFLEERGRERILSFEEERTYLACASVTLRDVGTIMTEMGLRPEEVFKLRKESVKLVSKPRYVHVESGKTEAARRDVPMTPRSFPVLHRRWKNAKGDYIFPRRKGNGFDWLRPMTTVKDAHRRALKRSEIKPRFRPYDLRHTYGTRAIEAGVDPLTLKKLMGHVDLKTTMKYVHLSRGHIVGVPAKMAKFRKVHEEQAKKAGCRMRKRRKT